MHIVLTILSKISEYSKINQKIPGRHNAEVRSRGSWRKMVSKPSFSNLDIYAMTSRRLL